MPSLITINSVDYLNVLSNTPSTNSVVFASELANLVKNVNFPTLFANDSIPTSKIKSIEGRNVAQMTLSGYNGSTSPGQIALRTITSANIGINAVKGPEGGVPSGTVIFYAGPDFERPDLPEGYHICDGSLLDKDAYADLFNAIGYRYGNDGSQKFKLPRLEIFQDCIPLIKL